ISIHEREILKTAMMKCKSTREMADYLGISQSTVVRKVRKHKISYDVMQ
ncbi:excisionase family DNA-binding protein, partial [candidate division KSB1 bacterium]|nr:excisionase family DNA-binding protein [candidate division KSB1 bacterium]